MYDQLIKEQRQFNGEWKVFSTNDAGTFGYHVKTKRLSIYT